MGKILAITGCQGTLGRAFARLGREEGFESVELSRQDLDITAEQAVAHQVRRLKAWAIVNTAGYARVDSAEIEESRCREINAVGARNLAKACAREGVLLLTFSSDLVFDGSAMEPYIESSVPNPLNAYGRSKVESERDVLKLYPSALVVRTSAFFGPWDTHNFAFQTVAALRERHDFFALADVTVSPTYVPDLVRNCLQLLEGSYSGICHVVNQGAVTWFSFAKMIASEFGLDASLVHPLFLRHAALPASRPQFSVLGSERGTLARPLGEALKAFRGEVEGSESYGQTSPRPSMPVSSTRT